MASNNYEKLLQPAESRSMKLRNRIVLAPMSSMMEKDYFITQPMIDYFEARARGGTGLIMVGACQVSYPVGAGWTSLILTSDDKYIPGFQKLAEAVHKHGAKIMVQLNHFGPADEVDVTHQQPIAASAIQRPAVFAHRNYSKPRELSIDELPGIAALFANAARRVKQAGCDGVEVDAGLRYLINSFLSPAFNKRQDQYGGTLENRARFLMQVIAAVREAVGQDYPVWCRINGQEHGIEGGITPEMSKALAPMLEKAGIDCIDVATEPAHTPSYPPGFNAPAAAGIKKVVTIPVMVGGRINADLGEKLLGESKADFICMGRGLIADPEMPNKLRQGRADDIDPCVYCMNCLVGDGSCTVNAAKSHEAEVVITPAQKQKKVMVVGGGPGGMEAARVAALRGHRVMLYEKGRQLGGQLGPASLLRSEYGALMEYLDSQVKKLGVEVHLKKEVTPELVNEVKPEALVLATGASSAKPNIPGMERARVLSAAEMQRMLSGDTAGLPLTWRLGSALMKGRLGLKLMRRIMKSWVPFGNRIVVIGSGLAGCEMGAFLVERNRHATIVDTAEVPYETPPMPFLRQHLKEIFLEGGGVLLEGVRYVEVNREGLVIEKDGEKHTLPADTIAFTAAYKPETALAQSLNKSPYEIHMAGDSVTPCGILEAIRDGNRVGRSL